MCFKQNHPKFVFLIVEIDFHVIVMNQTPLLARPFWSRPHGGLLWPYHCPDWEQNKITVKTMFVLPGSCGLAVFCPKTQNMSLMFLFTLLHFWLKYIFPRFYMILRSYAPDSAALIMMYDLTLVGQHCKRNILHFPHHEFVAMFFMPFVSHFLFSFNRVPIKSPWEQERMGNSFGAIVLWKTTINMMPVFGAFFSNKDTF